MTWLLRCLLHFLLWLFDHRPAFYIIQRKGKHMANVVEGQTDSGLSVVTLNKAGRVLAVALPTDIAIVVVGPTNADATVSKVDAATGAFSFTAGKVDGAYVLTPSSASQPLPGQTYTEDVTPDNTPASFAIHHS